MREEELSEDFIGGLVARYPRLFKGKPPSVMSDCPAGWRGLVDRFFKDLDAMLDDEQAKSFRVEQIKEKFAGLRIYWKLGKQATTVIDVISEGSIQRLDQLPQAPSGVFDQVSARVGAAEEEAAQTCQKCGSPGERRQVRGWLVTLCDGHYAERVKD